MKKKAQSKKNNAGTGNLYIACLALTCIAIYLVLKHFSSGFESIAPYALYLVLLLGGGPLVFELMQKLCRLELGADLLAGMSIVTSILLGEYLAGSLVVLMLSGGQALEEYAIKTASKAFEALLRRAPKTAHKKTEQGLKDIPVSDVAIGDSIVVFPHEICPVDGVVIGGNGEMDEAYLTGEPFLIAKAPGAGVISGAINGESSLTIRAVKEAVDSRYEQIIKIFRQSEQKRPRIRRLADVLGAWYTPFALLIAAFAWIFSGDAVRFLAVLVIATPCPLLIAIPVAIIGSISLCAGRGILIKNPAVLEQIDECKTMIFDKTGTLTYGKPTLTDQIIYDHLDPKYILKLVASLERYSKHPLARAVLEKAKEENIELIDVKTISEPKGSGLFGNIDGKHVMITGRKLLKDMQVALPKGEGLECVVVIDDKVAAVYRFRDAPRSESKSFIKHLSLKHGFKKVMIVSGDREEEVRYLADVVGISEVFANMSPEEKVDIVSSEMKKAKTAYLGDGINDAPALVLATCGIAFGPGSDVTAEAGGVVIMESSLEKVDEFLHIGKRMKTIGLQSAIGGITLSIIGMFIAGFGFLPPVAGAISQEVIDVIVILNALRTIRKPCVLTDISSD